MKNKFNSNFSQMSFFNSKKADISITILVILVLLICGVTLFVFVTSNHKSGEEINTPESVNNFYIEQEKFELYVYQAVKNVVDNNKNINEAEFLQKFKSDYYSAISVFSGNEYYVYGSLLTHLKNSENYEVKTQNNLLTFKINNFEFPKTFVDEKRGIKSIIYKRDIILEIPLNS